MVKYFKVTLRTFPLQNSEVLWKEGIIPGKEIPIPGKGGVFTVSANSRIIIRKSTFRNNSAESGSLLYTIDNDLNSAYPNPIVISESLIEGSSGKNSIFEIFQSTVIVLNSKILSSKINIFQTISSQLYLYNVSVTNISCFDSELVCFISSKEAVITAFKVRLNDIHNKNIGAGLELYDSSVYFIHSYFTSIYSPTEGSLFFAVYSTILLMNNNFFKYFGTTIKVEDCYAYVLNCVFQNEKADTTLRYSTPEVYKGSVLLAIKAKFLFIFGTEFIKNDNAINGGALLVLKTLRRENLEEINLFIFDSVFSFNKAEFEGGAVRIEEEFGQLINNIFKKNNAAYGAAIYFYVEDLNCNLIK